MLIETNAPKVKRSLKVEYNMPGSLQELVKRFGENVVLEHAIDNIVIAFQASVRSDLGKTGEKKLSDEKIIAKYKTWKPGTGRKSDPIKTEKRVKGGLASLLKSGMTKEQLTKMLQGL